MPSRILIHKRGASGDVLRTTVALCLFAGSTVDWLVDERNAPLLSGVPVRVLTSAAHLTTDEPYDLLLSLEENPHDLQAVNAATRHREIVGTYIDRKGRVRYTESTRGWFDMSLVSRFGQRTANQLKLDNRSSFQEHLFRMFGRRFNGQPYWPFGPLKLGNYRPIHGHRYRILLAPNAGPRWPNKEWAYFTRCERLLSRHWTVSVLANQPSLRALGEEISKYDLLVSLDSLPMHIALSQHRSVCSIFTCTSPWEIYDYNCLRKVVSPKLSAFYYLNTDNFEARSAIPVEAVVSAIESLIGSGENDCDEYSGAVAA